MEVAEELVAQSRVLVVDDDESVRLLFTRILQRRGHAVDSIASLADLRDISPPLHEPYDAVLLDMYLDDGIGLDAVEDVYRAHPHAKIVIITAQVSIELAVRAMNGGVSGFLCKDEPATETIRKLELILSERGRPASERPEGIAADIVGSSPALRDVLGRIERIRSVESTVLILGESGVGKELVARAVHMASRRKDGPFVAINCAAIPDHLLEAELFGYKKGAFTDAKADRKGFFEVCTNGTLLLDEIGEMSPNLQAKLLRVLQEREFIPIGARHSIKVSTRVIASTNRNIEESIESGRFREDLYYRLSVIRLDLPPLRERKDDIPALIGTFVDRFNRQFGKAVRPPSHRILARLRAYDWPGNVRELRNAVERAVIMAEGPLMRVEDLLPNQAIAVKATGYGAARQAAELPVKFADAKRDFERSYLTGILKLAGGNIAEAARLSGQYRTNIYRLINKYALDQAVYKR
jgi:DNA-binding NtrC family response regulator